MAEKVKNRYKVVSYLPKETLDAIDEYRAPLGMSRSTAILMMVSTFLIQQRIIDKSQNMDDIVNGVGELAQYVKQMTFEDILNG